VGGGVGDHIGQGPQPHPGQAGHREAARGQQRADLADRAGDGGAVHAVQHREGLMWQKVRNSTYPDNRHFAGAVTEALAPKPLGKPGQPQAAGVLPVFCLEGARLCL
jgi:hypothetical protein